MDRMSLYYFSKERQAIENRRKLYKLLSIFSSKMFKWNNIDEVVFCYLILKKIFL